MLDRESPLPLYEQLVNNLKEMALKQPFFDPLPSEKELARRFGVSRGTVRKAIETLIAQRILTRIRGKGTYVASRSTPRRIPLAMCELAELRQLGFSPILKHISIVQALPPEQVRKPLLIDASRMDRSSPPTWRVARLVEAAEKPVYRAISYLRTDQVAFRRERSRASASRAPRARPPRCSGFQRERPSSAYGEWPTWTTAGRSSTRSGWFTLGTRDRAAELRVSDLPPLPWTWLPGFRNYRSGEPGDEGGGEPGEA